MSPKTSFNQQVQKQKRIISFLYDYMCDYMYDHTAQNICCGI